MVSCSSYTPEVLMLRTVQLDGFRSAWPAWAEGLLADVAAGTRITIAARRYGITHPAVYGLAQRCEVFATALSAACGRPIATAAHHLPELPSLLDDSVSTGEGYAQIALAVVRQAARQAARGNQDAAAWLAQVRADILDVAPPQVRRRLAGVGD
jgi:hypothetical protein